MWAAQFYPEIRNHQTSFKWLKGYELPRQAVIFHA